MARCEPWTLQALRGQCSRPFYCREVKGFEPMAVTVDSLILQLI